MDQTPQPKGKFVTFATPKAQHRYQNGRTARRRPDFDGRVVLPGTDREFRVALWAGTDKTGKVMFSGHTTDSARSDDVMEQLAVMAGQVDAKALDDGLLRLQPGQVMLFTNGTRDAGHPDRPHFYGRWNPGTGEKLVSLGVWATKAKKSGQPMLAGSAQYPQLGQRVELEGAGYDVRAEDREGTAPDHEVGSGSR